MAQRVGSHQVPPQSSAANYEAKSKSLHYNFTTTRQQAVQPLGPAEQGAAQSWSSARGVGQLPPPVFDRRDRATPASTHPNPSNTSGGRSRGESPVSQPVHAPPVRSLRSGGVVQRSEPPPAYTPYTSLTQARSFAVRRDGMRSDNNQSNYAADLASPSRISTAVTSAVSNRPGSAKAPVSVGPGGPRGGPASGSIRVDASTDQKHESLWASMPPRNGAPVLRGPGGRAIATSNKTSDHRDSWDFESHRAGFVRDPSPIVRREQTGRTSPVDGFHRPHERGAQKPSLRNREDAPPAYDTHRPLASKKHVADKHGASEPLQGQAVTPPPRGSFPPHHLEASLKASTTRVIRRDSSRQSRTPVVSPDREGIFTNVTATRRSRSHEIRPDENQEALMRDSLGTIGSSYGHGSSAIRNVSALRRRHQRASSSDIPRDLRVGTRDENGSYTPISSIVRSKESVVPHTISHFPLSQNKTVPKPQSQVQAEVAVSNPHIPSRSNLALTGAPVATPAKEAHESRVQQQVMPTSTGVSRRKSTSTRVFPRTAPHPKAASSKYTKDVVAAAISDSPGSTLVLWLLLGSGQVSTYDLNTCDDWHYSQNCDTFCSLASAARLRSRCNVASSGAVGRGVALSAASANSVWIVSGHLTPLVIASSGCSDLGSGSSLCARLSAITDVNSVVAVVAPHFPSSSPLLSAVSSCMLSIIRSKNSANLTDSHSPLLRPVLSLHSCGSIVVWGECCSFESPRGPSRDNASVKLQIAPLWRILVPNAKRGPLSRIPLPVLYNAATNSLWSSLPAFGQLSYLSVASCAITRCVASSSSANITTLDGSIEVAHRSLISLPRISLPMVEQTCYSVDETHGSAVSLALLKHVGCTDVDMVVSAHPEIVLFWSASDKSPVLLLSCAVSLNCLVSLGHDFIGLDRATGHIIASRLMKQHAFPQHCSEPAVSFGSILRACTTVPSSTKSMREILGCVAFTSPSEDVHILVQRDSCIGFQDLDLSTFSPERRESCAGPSLQPSMAPSDRSSLAPRALLASASPDGPVVRQNGDLHGLNFGVTSHEDSPKRIINWKDIYLTSPIPGSMSVTSCTNESNLSPPEARQLILDSLLGFIISVGEKIPILQLSHNNAQQSASLESQVRDAVRRAARLFRSGPVFNGDVDALGNLCGIINNVVESSIYIASAVNFSGGEVLFRSGDGDRVPRQRSATAQMVPIFMDHLTNQPQRADEVILDQIPSELTLHLPSSDEYHPDNSSRLPQAWDDEMKDQKGLSPSMDALYVNKDSASHIQTLDDIVVQTSSFSRSVSPFLPTASNLTPVSPRMLRLVSGWQVGDAPSGLVTAATAIAMNLSVACCSIRATCIDILSRVHDTLSPQRRKRDRSSIESMLADSRLTMVDWLSSLDGILKGAIELNHSVLQEQHGRIPPADQYDEFRVSSEAAVLLASLRFFLVGAIARIEHVLTGELPLGTLLASSFDYEGPFCTEKHFVSSCINGHTRQFSHQSTFNSSLGRTMKLDSLSAHPWCLTTLEELDKLCFFVPTDALPASTLLSNAQALCKEWRVAVPELSKSCFRFAR